MSATASKVVGSTDGKAGFLGSIGVRFMMDGAEAGNRFSIVEHPMSAHALAAPLHRHNNEDEALSSLTRRRRRHSRTTWVGSRRYCIEGASLSAGLKG